MSVALGPYLASRHPFRLLAQYPPRNSGEDAWCSNGRVSSAHASDGDVEVVETMLVLLCLSRLDCLPGVGIRNSRHRWSDRVRRTGRLSDTCKSVAFL